MSQKLELGTRVIVDKNTCTNTCTYCTCISDANTHIDSTCTTFDPLLVMAMYTTNAHWCTIHINTCIQCVCVCSRFSQWISCTLMSDTGVTNSLRGTTWPSHWWCPLPWAVGRSTQSSPSQTTGAPNACSAKFGTLHPGSQDQEKRKRRRRRRRRRKRRRRRRRD